MRRIALVDLLHARAGDPPISLGIASIAASLKRARVPHRVFAHNVATPPSRQALTSLADAVADWRPHVDWLPHVLFVHQDWHGHADSGVVL